MSSKRRVIDQAKRMPVVRSAAVEALATIRAPLTAQMAALDERVRAIEQHMPLLLGVVTSAGASLRELRRDLTAVADETGREAEQRIHVGDVVADLSSRLDAHAATQEWLVGRLETVRAEMLHELRYGPERATGTAPKVLNDEKLRQARPGDVRLNIGAGSLSRAGYLNVDVRELPGIDIVAAVDDLPFEPGDVGEISSEHLLEHFPEEQLARQLLPYWRSLLRVGGRLRAVVPDSEAMLAAHARGEMSFEQLRGVTFGGQEYEGDFHFTMFTPSSLATLVTRAGFEEVTVVDRARRNGDCLEFELVATRTDP